MGSVRNSDVKLIALDRRYSHSELFSHILSFNCVNGYKHYHDAVKYCYDQWGMTVDVEAYARIYEDSRRHGYEFGFSPAWSYMDKYGDHRIYLSREAHTWIKLSNRFGV